MGCGASHEILVGFNAAQLCAESGIPIPRLRRLAEQFLILSEKKSVICKTSFIRCLRISSVANNPEALQSIFQVFDVDHSGEVDFREYVLRLAALARGTIEELSELTFALFDLNRDGTISKEELVSLLIFVNDGLEIVELTPQAPTGEVVLHTSDMYHSKYIPDFAEQVFAEFDADSNGVLDKTEFQCVARKHRFIADFLIRLLTECKEGYWVPEPHWDDANPLAYLLEDIEIELCHD